MAVLGEFPASDRFELTRQIGQGSFGRVYEAFDRERQSNVAMKVLREEPVGENVLRFKNEFRGLTEIRHPNIVQLHELHNEGGQWFFTMELLSDAQTLTSWVRPQDGPWSSLPDSPTRPLPPRGARAQSSEGEGRSALAIPPLDVDRLRDALRQLAAGIHAIHQRNKLHRDLKPNNVLVTSDGRVVLVDFGLATAPGESHAYGTPAYMAPEQCLDSRPGEEADWYSVGVMLYEALTGDVPFHGLEDPVERVLYLKVTSDPPAPRSLDPSLPSDLDELCIGLLQRNPRDRICEIEILRRLGVAAGHEHKRIDAPDARLPLFVGRANELASLQNAYDEIRAGESTILFVTGESGVGKSELVRRFVPSVRLAGATVLAGRCYERESVPYKAWDGVIDHLSDVITELGNDAASALVPKHADLLLSAFPVLRRVEALVRAPVGARQNLQPHERRARVFTALRDLLASVASRSPLVIVIDDLQWADQDSIDLMAAVTQPPSAPAMLLLATVRDSTDPQVASRVRARLEKLHSPRTLQLQALPRADAECLVQLLAGESRDIDATAVAAEAGGHPMFIEELVRHIGKGSRFPNNVRLDQALTERIAQLSSSARRVVEVLAVAGGPLSRDLGARALTMDVAEFVAHVETLQDAKFVRTDGTRRTDKVEPYHDRVRQAVLGNLGSTTKRACHERLAIAFETSGVADPEALSIHWHGAGDDMKAARFAAVAAEQAFDALAFDRAARLYQQAIDLRPDNPNVVRTWELLAESLVNAGRGAAAADAYHRAAALAEREAKLVFQQKAGEQHLRCGQIDAGRRAFEPLLAAHRLKMPSTRGGAVAALLRERAKLFVSSKPDRSVARIVPRPNPSNDRRMELCWSTMVGLFNVDQLIGVVYHSRHLRLARQSRDLFALSRGMSMEAIYLTANGAAHKDINRTLETAAELAARVNRPYTDAWVKMARGVVAFMMGSWPDAVSYCDEASTILRERCHGAAWEIDSAQQLVRWSLAFCGRLADLNENGRIALRDARERNDLYASMSVRSGLPNIAWLAQGEPDVARRETTAGIAQWSQDGFHVQHMFDVFAQTHIDMYDEKYVDAYARVTSCWPALERSGLLRLQLNRVIMFDLRARAALAKSKLVPAESGALRSEARKLAKKLHAERRSWAEAFATLLDAQLVDADQRAEQLGAAKANFDAASMQLHAAAAQAAQSELGRAAANRYLASQNVADPARLLRLFTPGL